jgi:hypothetical protein
MYNVIILLASSRKSYSGGSVSTGKFSDAPHCHCVYTTTFYESLAHEQTFVIPVKIKLISTKLCIHAMKKVLGVIIFLFFQQLA